MAGSQSAINADQEIAQLVVNHAAGCARLACTAKNESVDLALDLIVFPASVLLVALLLQRAGFWDGLLRILTMGLRRAWLAQAGFGAVLAVVFVAVSLPFGLYDAITVDPATQSGFRCPPNTKDCPFPELTRSDLVWNLFEGQFWHGLMLAAIFAVLAPLAFALARRRPLVLLAIAAGAYLIWAIVPHEAMWKQAYPLPDGPLKSDVAQIAQRAGIGMDRVLMGQPRMPMADGGGGIVQWLGGEAQAVISERLLNIHIVHPRAFSPPQGPYSAGEFRWVAAHEIAHVRHRHRELTDGAAVILAALFAGLAFAVARKITARGDGQMGAGLLPVFLALGLALHFVFLPMQRNVWRILENQADATALDLARDPAGAIAYTLQSARREPLVLDRWYHLLYRTHPDSMTRLRRIVYWKARNTAGEWSAQGLTGQVRTRWGDELEPVTDWPEKQAK